MTHHTAMTRTSPARAAHTPTRRSLGHIVTKLKPSADEPNAVVSQFRVVEALASAPVRRARKTQA
jgi:hypothetical protein